ncbi:branched-chain amino acid transport system II carrier protein [Psittacicella gerlachiana]|uniref:Branched-chain amino acid transport system carrier protein n=1 Tax=Psittacicella gerlachiana TaxID=2028574 RepID=A0A3A1YGW3_9GAMM|nr:branched-chain amino acid transport system II carrier protein [Psittacicella gerlachiana]RIY36696.1 branched-chain amino acid transport system II carrier protein [Psittacicella gerlachiana]
MKRIIFSGLMLMSFFFGAGNLIYPPLAGLNAGSEFLSASSGFTLTAVVIPFLTILAVALSGDSALSLAGRVGKVYGLIFTVIIILSIGPLFGIPRVANVSLDIGIKPLLDASNSQGSISPAGLFYILIFFFISFILSLYGDKLVDTIGKYLSPALVIFTLALVVVYAFTDNVKEVGEVGKEYVSGAFFKGAIDGYGTLDAIAAVAFAGLIVNALRPSPDTPKSVVFSGVIKAGFIACALLAVIYFGLAYVGNVSANSGKTTGADILVYVSQQSFGAAGQLVFAIIVFLACLTTAVGLLKTLSTYSRNLFGLLTERQWLILYTVFSAVLSVRGLDSVLKTSVPMIYLTYPITIVLVIVTLFNKWTKDRAWIYFWTALLVTPVAFADAFRIFSDNYFGRSIDLIGAVRDYIPLANTDFSWVTPFIVAVVIGALFPKKSVNNLLLGDKDAELRRKKQRAEEEFEEVLP